MSSTIPCFHGDSNIKAHRIKGVNVHNTYRGEDELGEREDESIEDCCRV